MDFTDEQRKALDDALRTIEVEALKTQVSLACLLRVGPPLTKQQRKIVDERRDAIPKMFRSTMILRVVLGLPLAAEKPGGEQ